MALWNRSWDDFYDPKEEQYTVQGTCQFSPSKGALLKIPHGDISMTRKLHETGHYEYDLEPTRYRYLYGITQNNIYLVLSDILSHGVEVSLPRNTSENLSANTVLSSRCKFDPDAPIVAAAFKTEGFHKWLVSEYYLKIQNDTNKIECSGEHTALEVYRCEKRCTITIHYGIQEKRSSNKVKISTCAKVHVNYTKRISLDDFWTGKLWRFQAFLAFCFGAYPAIHQVSVTLENNKNPVHVYRKSVGIEATIRLSRGHDIDAACGQLRQHMPVS